MRTPGRVKASSKDDHWSLSCATSFQSGPAVLLMSSSQRVKGRPLLRFPGGPRHRVALIVHLWSFSLATWPAHFHLSFWAWVSAFLAFVMALILVCRILSIFFILNMLRSIPRWQVLILFFILSVNFHVWQPYVKHGKRLEFKTFVLIDIGKKLLNISFKLQYLFHVLYILRSISNSLFCLSKLILFPR